MMKKICILRLSNCELIGSKINALIVRTTARDLFDCYTLFKDDVLENKPFIRKIAIFYICLGAEMPIDFCSIFNHALSKIDEMNFKKIKENLIPTLHKSVVFNLEKVKSLVLQELRSLFQLDSNDIRFIEEFNNKHFKTEILFDGFDIENVSNHPICIWKTK